MGVVIDHLAHLRRLGRRPGTIYQREQALRRLAASIAPTPVLFATLEELRAFTGRESHGAAAHAAEVSHLRGFYRWAVIEGLRVDDPTIRLERPSVPRRFPRPMPDEHVRLALALAPDRIRPWLHLAAYGGLRACEIAPLRAEHIQGNWIFIAVQKGGDEGLVRIPPPLRATVDELPSAGWLFPHRGRDATPGPTTAHQVSHLSNRWLHRQGIAHTLHTLRHWYGTNARRVSNGDLRVIQRMMRHRDISSTVIYTLIEDDEAAEVADRIPDLTQRPPDLLLPDLLPAA